MKETLKDTRDHAYGRARRRIRTVLNTENTGDKQEYILNEEHIHYRTDYVEFRKYKRYRGFSNHGKPNPKHDRHRRIKGERGEWVDKKIKLIRKADRKEED